ncbi:unnamed protein product [Vitrella brassicaformis CCMP3155]|uniref:Uncharacterized protein n=1 Tax=Vitrella brassicaformis (strain CCMP3155) TaxID=1169540 RepID=A0A0G4GM64_VITBC|nr:unnamed protein product [Vitrella brassicaformis CCMP3155]|eukprot:CEM31279.1 unnamed protein product [Vitrella brassicaformis CCMP3155]
MRRPDELAPHLFFLPGLDGDSAGGGGTCLSAGPFGFEFPLSTSASMKVVLGEPLRSFDHLCSINQVLGPTRFPSGNKPAQHSVSERRWVCVCGVCGELPSSFMMRMVHEAWLHDDSGLKHLCG